MKSTFTKSLPSATIVAVLVAGPGFAQSTNTGTQGRAAGQDLEEVVVTGTLIRGIAPASAQVISLGKDEAAATGALSGSQLLASIPQLNDFNQIPQIVGTNTIQVTVNRVNLRNLPGNNAGSSPTLVLMNGHRVVGAGIKQTQSEPDFLPPSILERVEVVPDGGSSLYGADAVGGVVNFITRRRFSGVQVEGHYGIADNYNQFDASLTGGLDWGSGSGYVAVTHAEHDALYGADRDYVKNITWATGLGAETNCTGNVLSVDAAGVPHTYVVSGNTLVAGRNFCDRSGLRTIYPDEKRDSVFANFSQDLGANITFDLHGFYTRREDTSDEGPLSGSGTITANLPFPPPVPVTPNPFYRNAPDASTAGRSQSVQFVYTPLGQHSLDTSVYESWEVTPSLTVNFGHEWELRVMGNYGRTLTTVRNPAIDAVAQGTAVALGQLNPYDITANSPTIINSMANSEIFGHSEQELTNGRAVFDGPLFSLPGGDVRAAVGVEYIRENYAAQILTVAPSLESTVPRFSSNRHTNAAFAELSIPIVGEKNAHTGIHALTASLSARYDDYSDFGSTTNPTLGLSYQPVEWIDIRGHWGKSFQAPSLADSNAADNTILVLPSSIIQNPFQPRTPTQPVEVIYQGSASDIQPQTAKTYSIGFDMRPPALRGLSFGATYYNIQYQGTVDIPPVFNAGQFFTQFTQNFVMSPTPAQTQAFIAGAPNAAQALASIAAQTGPLGLNGVYTLLDARRRNLGDAKVSGLDANIRYTHETGFGSVFGSLNGTYRLNFQTSPTADLPLGPNAASNASRLKVSTTVGGTFGANLRVSATLNHGGGFDVTPVSGNNFQTHVGSFDTVNLFGEYDFNGTSGLTQNLALTLGVNNVLDRDPPVYQGIFANLTYGYANGGTVGRLFQLGLSKKL